MCIRDSPDPVIGIAVEPKTQKDLDKLSNGLAKLAEEDPTFTGSGNSIDSNTIGASSSHKDVYKRQTIDDSRLSVTAFTLSRVS